MIKLNNMKLYKHEDVERLLRKEIGNNNILEHIQHIELPTEEDIEYIGLEFYSFDWIEGAKWVINEIKGDNK